VSGANEVLENRRFSGCGESAIRNSSEELALSALRGPNIPRSDRDRAGLSGPDLITALVLPSNNLRIRFNNLFHSLKILNIVFRRRIRH
jgi:hypothetical protein